MPKNSFSFNAFFKNRLFNHASFWITMVLLLAYHGSLFGGNFRDNLINMLVLLPVQIAAAYLLIYFQLPRWLFKKAWIKFGISLICSVYILSVLARLSVIHIAEPLIGMQGIDESVWEILSDPIYLLKVYMTSVYLPALVFFLIKMTKESFVQQNRLTVLEKEKRSAELNFLKAQMNPHFLFNTLNNIYALSLTGAEQTPEMILKLSEILDYTIYECKEERVKISREWELIENYADLQALRHHDQLMVVLEQEIDQPESTIAPLILIALVENAFKYALAGPSEMSNIKLLLSVKNQLLRFEIFNTKSEIKKPNSERNGIGVQNIKRQLNLLYPDRHGIQITEEKDTYQVILSIQL